MSAIVLKFPPPPIRVQRERDDEAWLVLTPSGHGWLHGGFHAAMLDAEEVATGFGLTVRSSAYGGTHGLR
jgi:hypothetical protein